MLSIIATLFIAYILYHYAKDFLEWRSKGIRGPLPLPFIGNALSLLGRPIFEFDYENFQKYGRIYVDYLFPGTSFLNISEPALIKQILVRDFHLFSQRDNFSWPRYVREGTFVAHGARWRRIRALISPIFTGNRIRAYYPYLQKKVDNCMTNLDLEIERGNQDGIFIRRLTKCTSIDILVKILVSIEINSYQERNKLYQHLATFFDVNKGILILAQILPLWMQKLFHIHLLNYTSLKYFVKVIQQAIKERREHPEVKYDDLLDMLMEAQQEQPQTETELKPNETIDTDKLNQKSNNGQLSTSSKNKMDCLSDDEIIAQCSSFFFAGSETAMSLMSKTLLQMALNPQYQEKLHEELWRVYPQEKINQDQLNESDLLKAVLAEVLRMTFGVVRLFRIAAEDCKIGTIPVRKGQNVSIPMYSLHHDPELYPNPMEFQPERFLNPETGSFSTSHFPEFSYIPFAEGPRKCVAYRFVQIELRLILINILKHYRVYVSNQTQLPVVGDPFSLVNNFNDFKLGFKRRPKSTS